MLRLKYERINANLTQTQVAEMVGISRVILAGLEKDSHYARNYSYEVMTKLSDLYGVPVEKLVKEIEVD